MRLERNPITGIAGCCALAASGHAAAAPPRRVMNSRRHGSFDHLVGDGEQRGRHVDAERPGRLQVDDELELGRLQHRQVGRLLALEDAAGIDADSGETGP